MKVLRSTLVAAVAIFAAACGDKVTVAGPTAVTLTSTTTTTPVVPGKVNSVSIAPATATLTIGQTITMIAAVNADAGIATTVTWTSSDATKASVSTAGLVTALVATPGVAICATSTANTGVKGCGSVVVTAASAVIPATATIAGVFGNTLTTLIDPTTVAGRVNVQVNISTGTEVVSKVYLLLGTAVVDSQNFSSAQSASLRYAGENTDSAAKDVAQPSIILTANTAAYNALTGAVTYPNAAGQTLSVQLFVVGTTAARSTAKYSSTLTLNNPDVYIGAWTLPSTAKNAVDLLGYQWTGFGGATAVATLKVIPVLYSGKTVSSATVDWSNAYLSGTSSGTSISSNTSQTYCRTDNGSTSTGCMIFPTGADTLLTKTVTSATPTFTFGLWDREFNRTTIATPATPKLTLVYTDGSSVSAVDFSNATSLALRIDNKGPARPTIIVPGYKATDKAALAALSGSDSASFRSKVVLAVRPANMMTTADSASIISGTYPTDAGVSSGATLAAGGMTFKAYRNAGGTGALSDTLQTTYSTDVTAGLTGLSETGKYCVRVQSVDLLGNTSPNHFDGSVKVAGAVVSRKCAHSLVDGALVAKVDDTAPVVSWYNAGSFSSVDTAVTSAFASTNYQFTLVELNRPTLAATVKTYAVASNVQTLGCAITTLASGACPTFVPVASSGTYSLTDGTSSFSSITSANGTEYIITVTARDEAGNVGTTVTRYIVHDSTVPTVTAANILSTTLGSSLAISGFGADQLGIASSAAMAITDQAASGNAAFSAMTGILPVDFAAVEALATSTGYTKFLNVALAQTVSAGSAPKYLFSNTVINSALGTTPFTAATLAWGFMVADQAGNVSATPAGVKMSYIDTLSISTTASGYAGITGGMNSSTASFTSVSLPGSANIAGTAATAASTGYPRVGVFQQKVRRMVAISATEAPFFGTLYRGNNQICETSRAGGYIISTTAGTEGRTRYAGTTAGVATVFPAPTVTAYIKIGTIGIPIGTVTKINSDAVAGASTTLINCDDETEDTYQVTYEPGVRTTIPFVTNTVYSVYFVYNFSGNAVVGPAITFTYTK